MNRLIAHHAFVADLDPDSVEKDQRVNPIKRPLLSGRDLVKHCVGHRADQIGRDVDAIRLVEVSGDLPRAHAARIHRHDLIIEARKIALILGDQLRIEARLTIAWHIDRQLAGVGHRGLPTVAVACVADTVLAGEAMVHLGVQRALDQRLLQRIE